MTETPLFLRALAGEDTATAPVWFMRQAGRYLPEYMALKEKHGFWTMMREPELAIEVTLQPIRRLGVDAAILFSDIMTPLPDMGVEVAFKPGPVVAEPLRSRAAIEALRVPEQGEIAPFVGTILKGLRAASPVPVIGFAGAPFTLGCYLVEGAGSKDYGRMRGLMKSDPETAQIAIQSALTGHLVFTTVHANNVVDVLGRFLNMGVEPYQFVSALNCVMAQRLVRLICSHCRRKAVVPATLLAESGMDPSLAETHTFYEGAGCIDCGGTGFKGRTAICELLNLSDPIREMILARRPNSEIKRLAHDEGMRFLRESAAEKVMLGMTTLREINKVTFVE